MCRAVGRQAMGHVAPPRVTRPSRVVAEVVTDPVTVGAGWLMISAGCWRRC
jgi:hypothetical protein